MTEAAIRYPCPVCLGAKLDMVRPFADAGEPAVERCGRCGGLWVALDDLARLRQRGVRRADPDALRPVRPVAARCHACGAALGRNDKCCLACRRSNTLPCPRCEREMTVQRHRELRFDRCRPCGGFWLDGHELHALWSAVLLPTPKSPLATVGDAASGAVDVLDVGDPVVRVAGGLVGEATGGAIEIVATGVDGLGGLGDAAAAVFEAVADIVGALSP